MSTGMIITLGYPSGALPESPDKETSRSILREVLFSMCDHTHITVYDLQELFQNQQFNTEEVAQVLGYIRDTIKKFSDEDGDKFEGIHLTASGGGKWRTLAEQVYVVYSQIVRKKCARLGFHVNVVTV